MVATNPRSPRVASRSMLGLLAASSGVLPPNSSHGQSAIPSPWMITYFMVVANYPFTYPVSPWGGLAQPGLRLFRVPSPALENLQHLADIGLDHDRIAEILKRRVGVLQPMTGESAYHDRARPNTPARDVIDR